MAHTKGARVDWGKTNKGMAEALLDAGFTLSKKGADILESVCEDYIGELDWEWPRGKRYDTTHSSNGRKVRGSASYASGYRGGNADHPWWSGNLHDSIVASVIDGTRIRRMVQMRPGATETQTYKGTIIDGVEEGLQAAQRAAHTFGPGVGQLRAVLTIGVPYAEEVNRSDNHYDYVSPMSEDFVQTIRFAMENMIPKQSIVARTKKHIRS